MAIVVVVDDFGSGFLDFGFGSAFCGFWLWVLRFVAVVMAVGCGCDGWLSWLVVTVVSGDGLWL